MRNRRRLPNLNPHLTLLADGNDLTARRSL
jgi:hypothetical protein